MNNTKEKLNSREINLKLLTVGDQVKKLRKRKDFTQENFAEALGISNMTMSRIENGITPMNIVILLKMSEILEVSPEEILRINENNL
ncbi:MAG: helix-turn-helix transcriptional regulator [Eubacteriales bacterium]|nr:helix-turn-helix transcriptional regulator [Eubacteriales bacterium]